MNGHLFFTRRHLCDMVHIPNKFGSVLFQLILPKQVERVGCTIFDLCSGATDGGGENVGWEGFITRWRKRMRRMCVAEG